MTRLFTQGLAISAAMLLTLGSIGAIVAVPVAGAGAPIQSVELA